MARSKRKLSPTLVVVLGTHVGLIAAMALIPQEKLREVVAIAMQEAPKEPPKPEPPKPAAQPVEPPSQARPSRSPRAPRSASSQPAAASSSRTEGFADLGLTLDSSSSDGLAVNMAASEPVKAAAPPAVVKPKVLVAKKPERKAGPPPKPRPLGAGVVRPTYTEEARRARIEGRVVLELSIDENGMVSATRVIDGLGYGLDEAAQSAAKNLRFAAAVQDGRPVASRFILAMRFLLGT